jgi:hypothetical protein
LQREIARQSHEHGTIGERLNDQIDVSWPAPTKAGDDIDERLLDAHDLADRTENFLRHCGILVGGTIAERIGRGALMHEGRRVRHYANDARARGRFLQRGDRQARDDGDDELPFRVDPTQRAERILRFHAKDQRPPRRRRLPCSL